MGTLYSELEDKIRQLRIEYRRVLPNRIELISEKLRRIAAQPGSSEMLIDAELDVHGLVGSASTFGLVDVSRKAHSLETALAELKGMAEQKRAGIIQGRIWGYFIVLKEATRRETQSDHVREFALKYAADLSIPSQHVLVGSEEPGTRALLCAYLEHVGHRVLVADSAQAIESLCGQREIDVALVDASLCQEMGLQNLRARFRSNTSQALICLMTSIDLDAMVETAVRSGADDVLVKPISVVRLHARLFSWHRRYHSQSGPVQLTSDITLREAKNFGSTETPYA